MSNASFRAALLAGAVAFASTAGFVLSGGTAGAQDATTNTETTTPAPDASAPAAGAPAEAAPTGTPAPSANGAPTPADPAEVVATVNGKPITRQDVLDSASDLPPQYQAQIDKLFPQLLNRLIGIQLVEAKGREQGLADDPEVKRIVKQAEEEAISRIYIQKIVSERVTDESLQQAYDADNAAHPAQIEIRASHILVKTEDEAKEIIKQLQGGADFATLAKEKSIEPGAKDSGGDLGYFTQDKMVKPFADAAFALKVNEVSQPVQTQFGWHIIQVLDRRPAAKPTLEQLTQQIGQQLYVQKYRTLFDQLRKATTIDIPDATLKQQVEAQLGPNQ